MATNYLLAGMIFQGGVGGGVITLGGGGGGGVGTRSPGSYIGDYTTQLCGDYGKPYAIFIPSIITPYHAFKVYSPTHVMKLRHPMVGKYATPKNTDDMD